MGFFGDLWSTILYGDTKKHLKEDKEEMEKEKKEAEKKNKEMWNNIYTIGGISIEVLIILVIISKL